jgi:hypothetical protein
VTPIGQQNPPGQLKLLGWHEKTGQNTDFDCDQIKLKVLDYAFDALCGSVSNYLDMSFLSWNFSEGRWR